MIPKYKVGDILILRNDVHNYYSKKYKMIKIISTTPWYYWEYITSKGTTKHGYNSNIDYIEDTTYLATPAATALFGDSNVKI